MRPARRPNPARRAIAACRRVFLCLGLFSLCINLLALTVPLYMMQMYDRVIATRNLDTLMMLTVMATGALVVLAGLDALRSRIAARLGAWLDRQLTAEILGGSIDAALRSGRSRSARGLRDLATLRGFIAGPGMFPLLDAPWAPVFLLIVFLFHPLLGWIGVAGAIFLFNLALANELVTRRPTQEANETSLLSLYAADATVRNADAIQAMGMKRNLLRRWHALNEDAVVLQTAACDRGGAILAVAKFVRLFLQIAMLGVGAYLVARQEISGGAMIASAIILSRAMAPVEQSLTSWKGLIAAQMAYRQIRDLLERSAAGRPATMPLPRPTGRLSVESVTFAGLPGNEEPILKQVSFALAPGEALGLIGPTAAGKTTLARLIIGTLAPTAGHVRLDGADTAVWDAHDRGPHVGYLPQDVELFAGTIRENIARFDDVAPEAIVEAAQLAGVHEMILRLPNGYGTEIGEGGLRLSGGQRQRIALARALFGDPRLVVLDEPNANLDGAGDEALVAAITALRARKATIVVVAHRPGVLRYMDKILVLRDGRVERFGAREEVLPGLTPTTNPTRRAEARPVLVAAAQNEPGRS